MPKTQTKPRRLHRFFGWFGRHKVSGVLLVLVLSGVIYWGISSLVWTMQVRAERGRYEATAAKLDELAKTFPNGGQVKTYRQCSYTSNGAVFATRSLGCLAGIDGNYTGLTLQSAQAISKAEKDVLLRKGILLRENTGGYGHNDISNYTYVDNGLSCGFLSTYYDASVPTSQRYQGAPANGMALFMDISCSGPAKAEYFPVVQH